MLTVVVVGGSNTGGALASGEAIRFPGGSVGSAWTAWTDLPCARFLATAASLPSAHSALLLGGEPQECRDTLKWSGDAGAWEAPDGASAAVDTVGARAVSAVQGDGDEAVLLLGGRPLGVPAPMPDASVFRLETLEGNTTLVRETTLFGVTVDPMPTPRSEFGAAWASNVSSNGSIVVVVGGVVDASAVPVATADVLDTSTGTWAAWPPIDTALRGLALVVINGMFVVIGGETEDGDVVASGWSIPVDNSAGWMPIANMTTARAFHSAAAVGSGSDEALVCVAGGIGPAGASLRLAECWNPATDRWSPAPPLSAPRAYAATVTFHT